MRGDGDVAHVVHVAQVVSRYVVGGEMFMLIPSTTAIKLDIASRGFLPKIRQFRKTLPSHYN